VEANRWCSEIRPLRALEKAIDKDKPMSNTAARVRAEQHSLMDEITRLEHRLIDLRSKQELLARILGAERKVTTPTTRKPRTSGKTIPHQIIKILQAAGHPLATRAIIQQLRDANVGAAEASIYSSINRMKQLGVLVTAPHEGRGIAYAIADASLLEAPAEPMFQDHVAVAETTSTDPASDSDRDKTAAPSSKPKSKSGSQKSKSQKAASN
jgi:Fe2+ or Zn2+ uptake regulation protein